MPLKWAQVTTSCNLGFAQDPSCREAKTPMPQGQWTLPPDESEGSEGDIAIHGGWLEGLGKAQIRSHHLFDLGQEQCGVCHSLFGTAFHRLGFFRRGRLLGRVRLGRRFRSEGRGLREGLLGRLVDHDFPASFRIPPSVWSKARLHSFW